MDQFVRQLRDFVGQATGSLQRLPSLGLPSPPGALSAAQVQAIARGVGAQRTQITAITEQLGTLDAQLAVLERLLEPLVQWCSTRRIPERPGPARRASGRTKGWRFG
jgi:hypothetical protein